MLAAQEPHILIAMAQPPAPHFDVRIERYALTGALALLFVVAAPAYADGPRTPAEATTHALEELASDNQWNGNIRQDVRRSEGRERQALGRPCDRYREIVSWRSQERALRLAASRL
jgi:hypothetical protein